VEEYIIRRVLNASMKKVSSAFLFAWNHVEPEPLQKQDEEF
jgi:hypothetical protein